MNSETKVGILFFIGLGLMLWFTIYVSKVGGGEGGYEVSFAKVAGLAPGSAVTYNGIPIGRVTAVTPDLHEGEPLVRVVFNVEPSYVPQVLIGPDSCFKISQGMLGGASLTIDHAGTGEPISNEALAGHVGEAPMTFSEALEQVGNLMAENRQPLNEAITGLPEAIGNFSGMSATIRDTIGENREVLREAVVGMRDMSHQVATIVSDNREDLNRAIRRMDAMAEQIHDLVVENRPAVKLAAERLPAAVQSIDEAAQQMRDMVAENREGLGVAIEHLAKFAPKLERIGDDLAVITAQVRSGQGTVGRLVFEDTLHSKATSTLDNFNQRLEEVEPFTSGISGLKFYTGVEAGYNTDTGAGRYGGYLRIEPKPWKYYEAGVSYRTAPSDRDTIDEDPEDFNIDLNVLIGYRFFPNDVTERYGLTVAGGIIESKLGGKADVALWSDRLTWSTMMRAKHDAFDPSDRRFEAGDSPMLRSWLEWRIWRRVAVIAGADDILDDAAPWIGIRGELLDNDIRNFTTAAGVLP